MAVEYFVEHGHGYAEGGTKRESIALAKEAVDSDEGIDYAVVVRRTDNTGPEPVFAIWWYFDDDGNKMLATRVFEA